MSTEEQEPWQTKRARAQVANTLAKMVADKIPSTGLDQVVMLDQAVADIKHKLQQAKFELEHELQMVARRTFNDVAV